MYNYLYTNDMRISDLPDSIKRVSEILLSGMEPYQVDKSFGNNGATIQFYFNLQDNTETLIKGKDATLEVIRNFILKFQFPNTRTLESFRNTLNDKILFAPYRAIISVLYKLALNESNTSHLTHDEILFFFFCNSEVCTNPNFDIDKLINGITSYRNHPYDIASKVKANIRWNQYERQLREMMTVLQYASSIFKNRAGILSFVMPTSTDDIAFIHEVISYNRIWYPSNIEDFNLSNKEYISYMDTAKTPYYVIELNKSHKPDIKTVEESLQQIYFGAPGTGKSHEIKKNIGTHKSFRITFHPDTDYSSFVGAYKPTSVEVPMLTTLGEKAIPVKDMEGNPLTENKIIYTYVKQAFLNAYIEAWKEQANETPQPVYLVIEEINRGNCAQIFGDIFQLLDRNTNGFSDYAIVPDADLSRHVKKDLEKLVIANKEAINAIYEECEEDMVDKVVNGKVLLLPNNLYIWATMNTSDQSLFPIDSAFKRRWDWKYIKIADAHENWQIKVGTKTYDWWQFVQAINYFVFDATQSEDKNLGYFFAKAKDSIINAETFVSKVIFYLYTDVFKDYGFSGDIFKGANDDEMTFQSFYNADGSPCEAQIIRFIENVMFSDALPETLKVAVSTEDEDMNVYDEDEAIDNRQSSNRDKFMVNGAGSYGKCLAPFEAVKAYSKQNPLMNAAEIVQVWSNLNVNHMPHLVETEQEFEERAKTTKDVKFRVKAKRLELPNGEVIYVSNQFNPIRIAELIEKLNKANLGVNISLIEA